MKKEPEIDQHFAGNFFVFALNLISLRVGWIFKTETIIMPGFLYTLTNSSAIRGCLPLISRLGRSLPQFLIAHRITSFRRKKGAFFLGAILLCVPWGLLSIFLWLMPTVNPRPMTAIFIAMYAFHWIANGATILLSGTLQGKLIPVQWRGRLLAISSLIGCFLAIGAAYFLLPRWLREGSENYALVFGVTSLFFAISALAIPAFKEPEDVKISEAVPFSEFALSSAKLIFSNGNFRRFIYTTLLYYASMVLFHHYTVFGMEKLGMESTNFVQLLIAQNFVNAVGSLVMGTIADRYGNRIVLRFLIAVAGCIPWIAIGMSRLPADIGIRFYWLVFAFIGFTPVTQMIITNYTLEISPVEKHPQYLGTLNVIQLLPLLTAPIVGWTIDRISFEPVFIVCSILIFCGALMTFRIDEPRLSGRKSASKKD